MLAGLGAADYSGLHRFDDVDATGEQGAFAHFLERVEGQPDVVVRRRRSYELLALQPDDLVADVGCGLGTATRELAALGVRAIGFDASEGMVAEARQRGTEGGVEFVQADVNALPLADGTLAGYRAERLYQHLAEPSTALAEARRVLAPGGRIVLVDQDWDAFVIDGEPRELTRSILLAFSDSMRNGWIGRSFRRLLTDAGFVDVEVWPETVVHTRPLVGLARLAAEAALKLGVVDAAAVESWVSDQERRVEEGRFFAAMTHFVAAATSPTGT